MDCRVCGRQFDPMGFQVMVPGLPLGFDRVDCALEAGALEPPGQRSAEPVPAVVRPLPTAVAPIPALAAGPPVLMAAKADSMRPQLLTGANLALLAAGVAATVYLWLRVFGADAGPFAFLAERASQAFGRTSVAATVDLTPALETGPEPENTVRAAGPPPLILVATAPNGSGGDATPVSDRSPREKPGARTSSGPVARPAQPTPEPTPPAEPGPARSAPAPTFPVPSSPPEERVPGPTLPSEPNPEQPALPGGRP